MAISKVILNGVTQMDITDTTATAEDVANGKVFYMASGLRTVGTGSGGLTDDVKTALLNCFEHVAWIDDQGQTYYDELYNALHGGLDSISAVYTQTGTVYTTDSLDILRSDLVVTATYGDGTTRTVTTYTLSGTLTIGTSTITATYMEKTATFSVTVSARLLYNWDFRTSLTDTVSGRVAELRQTTSHALPTRNSNGVNFNAPGQGVLLLGENVSTTYLANKTVQIDVTSFAPQSGNASFHTGFLTYAINPQNYKYSWGIIFRQSVSPNLGWNIYGNGSQWGSAEAWGPLTDRTAISGHTVSIYFDSNLVPTLYIDSVLKGKQTLGFHQNGFSLMIGETQDDNPAARGCTFYDAIVSGCRIYEGEVV